MTGKRTWRVTVYEPFDPRGDDSDDNIIIDGLIQLTQDEAIALRKHFMALDEEHSGFIGGFDLATYEAPEPITEKGIVAYLMGNLTKDGKRELAEIWKDPESVFDGTEVV